MIYLHTFSTYLNENISYDYSDFCITVTNSLGSRPLDNYSQPKGLCKCYADLIPAHPPSSLISPIANWSNPDAMWGRARFHVNHWGLMLLIRTIAAIPSISQVTPARFNDPSTHKLGIHDDHLDWKDLGIAWQEHMLHGRSKGREMGWFDGASLTSSTNNPIHQPHSANLIWWPLFANKDAWKSGQANKMLHFFPVRV